MTTDDTRNAPEAKPEHHSTAELRAEADRARAALAGTLDAIEYKLNVPKQVKINTRRFTLGLHRLGEDNPPALAGIAFAAAATVGTVVWWGVKTVLDRR
ncbi:DUF3618 domain-containing protein [Cryobacterium arcticum]|uniref:DUF3618 domain-containing protein n=1 Tax=Cryobacterium arcticum TaxID=670052 RepID=A0A317ZYH1_9MICO|nr:DUF3618 domain-containing protein [Cryobacterium arcticum]PXA72324.1 hypothetical protein CTB96_05480 [Cryobacterium arcticum]